MTGQTGDYRIVPFPKIRRLMVDGGRLGRQKHLVHGLVELDVTDARRRIHAHRQATGEALSFTGFMIACLGQALDGQREMQVCRTWRERLAIYDDVDVNTMFEVAVDGRTIIRPHIIRAANRKSFRDIHEEIRAFQANHARSREAGFITWFVRLPAPLRRAALSVLLKSPRRFKALNGTVSLTSVGMFGQGGGWGIPVSNHTLQLTLGGLAHRPALIDGVLETREMLCVTLTIDHDVVDGAPAARFVQRLRELVEGAHGLQALDGGAEIRLEHGGPDRAKGEKR